MKKRPKQDLAKAIQNSKREKAIREDSEPALKIKISFDCSRVGPKTALAFCDCLSSMAISLDGVQWFQRLNPIDEITLRKR